MAKFYKITGNVHLNHSTEPSYVIVQANNIMSALETYTTLRRSGKLREMDDVGDVEKVERVYNVFLQSDLGPTGDVGINDKGIA